MKQAQPVESIELDLRKWLQGWGYLYSIGPDNRVRRLFRNDAQ